MITLKFDPSELFFAIEQDNIPAIILLADHLINLLNSKWDIPGVELTPADFSEESKRFFVRMAKLIEEQEKQ